MKINKVYFPLLLSMVLAVGLLLGSKLNSFTSFSASKANSSKQKLNRLIDFIENEYVDEINSDSIVNLTVTGILENLDPHSVYIEQNELKAVTESMRGDFVGIGVNFYVYNDTVAIIKPVKNGPSDKAGLKAGDRILFANKSKLFDKQISTDSLFAKLKGEEGSEINLTIFRKETKNKFNVTFEREKIPLNSVDIALKVADDIGYIKINRFSETTYDEFIKGLTQLKKQGIQELIIDVRENGGGYLEIAVAIADELLKEDVLILKTINKKGTTTVTKASKKGLFEKGKVYILIDENSASASEILAGAIQDNDRGTIVGRRSFGKGLVQREMKFADGSAVRLTIARYYTPSGRSIQKPYSDKKEGYFNEFEKRFRTGELYEADSLKVSDSLKFKTKNGRIVYGGGGISPDVFVPYEIKDSNDATFLAKQTSVISYFVFEQLDNKRAFFSKLTLDELQKEIITKDTYFNAFKNHLTKSGFYMNFSKKELLKKYIYAEFVRQLFDDDKYYQVIVSEDEMVKKVIELKNKK